MERFPKLESWRTCLYMTLMVMVGSTQLALADSNAPPGSEILPGVYQVGPVIAQQGGWPNNPPQWQSTPGNTSSMPAPPPQNPSYQPQPILPSNDPNPYGTSIPAQPMQGYTQFQQQQPQIQPGQLQGYPVSQQAPGQLPSQGYGAAPQYPQQGYAQQQPQYPPQSQTQSQQASAPASPPGWQADYPNPNDVNNTAAQVPMDTAQPQKQGIGSKLGKALGGVAKMAGPMAGMGMAGMAAASMGNMMMGSYGMGMGGYGMPMGMGGMGMGGMGGYGMPMGMGMGGYGMPMGMGGMGMGMGQNMMMNSVLNQGLRMLQR